MKKNITILHGYGETPDSFWYPYVKKQLESKGYTVFIPQLPHTDNPNLPEQLDFALQHIHFDTQTILIGHSSGCPLILAILENISPTIHQAIFVAGYATPLTVGRKNTKNIKEHFDWNTIKKHCEKFIFINAQNDPWGADDKQGKIMFDNLGGILIINQEGHMGSDTFKQPYKEFPFLVSLLQ